MCYNVTFWWTVVQFGKVCTFKHSHMYHIHIFAYVYPTRPDKLNTCSNTPQYTHSVSWMLALTEYPKNTYSISWILNVEVDFKAVWVGQKAALPWDIELNPLFSGLVCGLYGHIPIVEYVYFGLSYSHIRIKEYDIYVAKWSKRVAFVLVNRSNKCISGFRVYPTLFDIFDLPRFRSIFFSELRPPWNQVETLSHWGCCKALSGQINPYSVKWQSVWQPIRPNETKPTPCIGTSHVVKRRNWHARNWKEIFK